MLKFQNRKNTLKNRNQVIGALVIVNRLKEEGKDKVATKDLNGFKLPKEIKPCYIEYFDYPITLVGIISIHELKKNPMRIFDNGKCVSLNETNIKDYGTLSDNGSYCELYHSYRGLTKYRRYYYDINEVQNVLLDQLYIYLDEVKKDLRYYQKLVQECHNIINSIPDYILTIWGR